jgi:hypothetical protein
LHYPGGEIYTYRAQVLTLRRHRVEELEARGLHLLLPFTVLGFRKEAGGKTPEKERQAVEGLKDLLAKLPELIDRGVNAERLNETDAEAINYITRFLCNEVYKKYEAFKEVIGIYDDLDERWENSPYRKAQRKLEAERQWQQLGLERRLREYKAAGNRG